MKQKTKTAIIDMAFVFSTVVIVVLFLVGIAHYNDLTTGSPF